MITATAPATKINIITTVERRPPSCVHREVGFACSGEVRVVLCCPQTPDAKSLGCCCVVSKKLLIVNTSYGIK